MAPKYIVFSRHARKFSRWVSIISCRQRDFSWQNFQDIKQYISGDGNALKENEDPLENAS
jgi:hypothetical protein